MTQLEVGELSIVRFGAHVQLLHPFERPFTDEAGARILRSFGFRQTKRQMVSTLEAIVALLDHAKQDQSRHHRDSSVTITQIVFLIISDGRFDTDSRTKMQKLVQVAMER
jgi:midasin